ncbi:MAG: hypothetical protein R3B09_21275 [Nannocystaceae bacterium]
MGRGRSTTRSLLPFALLALVYPASAAAAGPAGEPVPKASPAGATATAAAGPAGEPVPKASPSGATAAAPPASKERPGPTARPAPKGSQGANSPAVPGDSTEAAASAPDGAGEVSEPGGEGHGASLSRKSLPTRPPLTGPYRGDGSAADHQRTRESLGLVREKDGSYSYVDPYKRFTARFNPDGTVNFADRWRRPDRENAQHGGCCGLPRGLFGPNGMSVTGPTEWAIALAGEDRDARVKAELLASTREMRTGMAIAWNLDLLARRLGELERELLAIWARTDMTEAARRELLFRRWDECDEAFKLDGLEIPDEALGPIDKARIDTAEEARTIIERFVRERLPKGSADAYRPAELTRLNAGRLSRRPFDPYARKRSP